MKNKKMSEKGTPLKLLSQVTLEAISFDNKTFDMHMLLSNMTPEYFVPFRQHCVTTCPL